MNQFNSVWGLWDILLGMQARSRGYYHMIANAIWLGQIYGSILREHNKQVGIFGNCRTCRLCSTSRTSSIQFVQANWGSSLFREGHATQFIQWALIRMLNSVCLRANKIVSTLLLDLRTSRSSWECIGIDMITKMPSWNLQLWGFSPTRKLTCQVQQLGLQSRWNLAQGIVRGHLEVWIKRLCVVWAQLMLQKPLDLSLLGQLLSVKRAMLRHFILKESWETLNRRQPIEYCFCLLMNVQWALCWLKDSATWMKDATRRENRFEFPCSLGVNFPLKMWLTWWRTFSRYCTMLDGAMSSSWPSAVAMSFLSQEPRQCPTLAASTSLNVCNFNQATWFPVRALKAQGAANVKSFKVITVHISSFLEILLGKRLIITCDCRNADHARFSDTI